MIRRFFFILPLSFGLSLYGQTPAPERPIYDEQGHLIAYQYSDGKRDVYSYDASWRIVSFAGRDGKLTRYVYKEDGTVQEVHAPVNPQ